MITIIFDGECPLCQDYVRRLRLAEVAGGVELVDARTTHPAVITAWQNGYDLDQGMLALIGNQNCSAHARPRTQRTINFVTLPWAREVLLKKRHASIRESCVCKSFLCK